MWSFCGHFVVNLWPFIGHFGDAFSLGEKQERMQYEILDDIWGGKPTTTTEAGRTQRYVATNTFCDRPTRFQRRHELFQATNPSTDGKMESTSFSVPLGIASSDYIGGTCSVEWFQMDCVVRGNWKRQSWMTCRCAYILVGCSDSSSNRLWSLLLRNRRLPDFKVLLSLSCLEYPVLDAKLPSFWSDHLSFLMPAALLYCGKSVYTSTGFGWKITLTGGAHSIFSIASHHAHSNGVGF